MHAVGTTLAIVISMKGYHPPAQVGVANTTCVLFMGFMVSDHKDNPYKVAQVRFLELFKKQLMVSH